MKHVSDEQSLCAYVVGGSPYSLALVREPPALRSDQPIEIMDDARETFKDTIGKLTGE
jgi:hypothetical protein